MKQNKAKDWKENNLFRKNVDEKWKEKIWLEIKGSPESQNLMLNCDLSPSTTLSIIKDILWIAIHKTEQHFKDLMPHESYVKRQVERESQAFADWLENWAIRFYGKDWLKDLLPRTAVDILNKKIKQMRNEGNKPFEKSLEGKDK